MYGICLYLHVFLQAKVEQVLALDPFDEIEKSTMELVLEYSYIHIILRTAFYSHMKPNTNIHT